MRAVSLGGMDENYVECKVCVTCVDRCPPAKGEGLLHITRRFTRSVHFHTLVLDGVFSEAPGGALAFHAAPGPSDAEVAAALATIRHRVQRLLVRRGLEPGDDATGPADRLVDESPVLAGIVGASVQGRVALGSRAGARVRRLGEARDRAIVTSRGPRQAHLDGFDLHANVWVSAHDRAGLERLARYVLRPPFAQERLRLRGDGRIALELKTAWRDGRGSWCSSRWSSWNGWRR